MNKLIWATLILASLLNIGAGVYDDIGLNIWSFMFGIIACKFILVQIKEAEQC